MAARPFGVDSEASNYGTVSGQSAGFHASSRDVPFSRLKETIGNSVITIKQNTQLLRNMERQVGSPSDSNDIRTRIQSVIRATLTKVETSKQQLSELMLMARRTGDKGQQFAANSVQQTLNSATNDFNTVVERVIEKLQQHAEPPRMTTPQSASGYLDSGELDIHGDTAHLVRSSPQQQQSQDLIVSTEASYLEDRADRMGELEHDITQLHEIMGEIGQMVVVQGEQINTIEKNTEDAAGNVTEANNQLGQAVRLKKCSRKLLLIIACIVGAIAIIIIIAIIIAIAVAAPKNNK